MRRDSPYVKHPPTRECETEHCHLHDVDEDDGIQRCGECQHSYPTWAALLTAWAAGYPGGLTAGSKLPDTPYSIGFCPECGHNF